MGPIASIIVGMLITAAGVLMTIKSEWFLQNFGAVAWAEEKLGSSRFFYKLFGALIAFIGIMVMTGLWRGILLGTVGQLFAPPKNR